MARVARTTRGENVADLQFRTAAATATLPAMAVERFKTALICGVGGQDGAYLAAHLLQLGYRVVGTSRDARAGRMERLRRLGILDHVALESMDLTDFRSVMNVMSRHRPDEIYNLAGQTSVGVSFSQPVETFESIVIGVLNLLEVVRMLGYEVRLFNAGSAEMFGDTGQQPASEGTPPKPCSPYGVAKATAFWQIAQYRQAYGMHACTGILFNHESPLRPERFVTQKIVMGACRIADGTATSLALGDLSVQRDWGWAPEYVVAMHRMLQREGPEDFVIATGVTSRLEDFVAEVFAALGLDWRRYVTYDPSLNRPSEIAVGRADATSASRRLGWTARFTMRDVAHMMVEAHVGKTGIGRLQAA
jgi:GDPmannose 4,6-dehydratase